MFSLKSVAPELFYDSLRLWKSGKVPALHIHNRAQIGNRDWVCFGKTGGATYMDVKEIPFPAIRFKENSNELLALREKEKGDWRKLTIEEKKILYRASFRQTFSEIDAPTGQWKSTLGWTLFFCSLGVSLFTVIKLYAYDPLPPSFQEENRRKMFRMFLVQRTGHLTGLSSKWDYELDDWKK